MQQGDLIAVDGNIKTNSYEENGKTYYTTDIKADRIQFLSLKAWQEKKPENIPESIEAEDGDSGLEPVPQDEQVPF